MKDPRQLLAKSESDSKNYRLEITQIRLKLVYAEFEARIRDK